MAEIVLTLAKFVVGGAGLWLTGGSDPVSNAAIQQLVEDASKFGAVLRSASLHNVEKRMSAHAASIRRNLAKSGDFQGATLTDAESLFAQALPHCLPNPEVMVEYELNPEKVAQWMLEQIAQSPVARDFNNSPSARRYMQAVTVPVLQALFDDKEFDENKLRKQVYRRLLEMLKRTQDMVAKLDSAIVDKLIAAGAREGMVLQLARQIAPDTLDFDQAMRELSGAVQIATDFLQRGRDGNAGEFVESVLRRAREKTAAGQLGAARDEIARALAIEAEDERERHALSNQRRLNLLSAGIDIDILRRDAAAAARAEAQKVELENFGLLERFSALRAIQDGYYELGRDKGTNLDLEIAIALARSAISLDLGWEQHGAALTSCGNAQLVLGMREARGDRLEVAVKTYGEALLQFTRERHAHNWASIQNNLGTAMRVLGERVGSQTKLAASIEHYRACLDVWTRATVPFDWATAKNNLATVLTALGREANDTIGLEEAVIACDDALLVRTRERKPFEWAMTQNNRGNALLALGRQSGDAAKLEAAVVAYENSLLERTQERLPLDWAKEKNNLGSALRALGERLGSVGHLGQAVSAHNEALKERTRERVPLDWSSTQNNLAKDHLALFRLTGDPAGWRAARAANDLALGLLRSASAPANLAKAEAAHQLILAARPPGELE